MIALALSCYVIKAGICVGLAQSASRKGFDSQAGASLVYQTQVFGRAGKAAAAALTSVLSVSKHLLQIDLEPASPRRRCRSACTSDALRPGLGQTLPHYFNVVTAKEALFLFSFFFEQLYTPRLTELAYLRRLVYA